MPPQILRRRALDILHRNSVHRIRVLELPPVHGLLLGGHRATMNAQSELGCVGGEIGRLFGPFFGLVHFAFAHLAASGGGLTWLWWCGSNREVWSRKDVESGEERIVLYVTARADHCILGTVGCV